MHKIIIVDDHTLFRDGLKLILSQYKNIEIVAECSNGQEYLDILPHHPNCITLMDINMPKMNGIEATKEAIKINPSEKIIVLSMMEDDNFYLEMIEAGVKGFILKNVKYNELYAAIEKVANGKNAFSFDVLQKLVKNNNAIGNTPALTTLTPRELEVLQLICDGKSNNEIADKLFLSRRTVDKHRANLMEKTDTTNTATLVAYAIKNKHVAI